MAELQPSATVYVATSFLLAQAEALPQLCSELSLAEGLRQLVLELSGRATDAVSARLVALSSLTQLDSLRLYGVAIWSCIRTEDEQLRALLLPLTQLTRLELRFEPERDEEQDSDDDDYISERDKYWDNMHHSPEFPWQRAVCGLSKLQDLHVSLDADTEDWPRAMFKGDLDPALSQLTALRRLSVLGMELWDVGDNHDDDDDDDDHDSAESNQLQLAALPALETVALRLHTFRDKYPGLGSRQQVVLSRLVSLSLALRYEFDRPDSETHLPAIAAPAMTELILDGMMLAADSEQLSWLPGLPSLKNLVLKDMNVATIELPHGIIECSGLTELVLERFMVSYNYDFKSALKPSGCLLRSLPVAGPYLSGLRRLWLPKNAFNVVPPCLATATALEMLDLADQQLSADSDQQQAPRVLGLHVLGSLTRLWWVDLSGFSQFGTRRFQAAHPSINIML